jgi:hypothetical protein
VDKQRAKNLFTNLRKHFKEKQTWDERDKERELKAMPRDEMTEAQEYEADILQIDSLMYIPVDWGESDSPNNKRRRGQVVSIRHRMKPRVREHFKGLIKSPETNTTNVVEDLSPAWVEDVFRPVFVELVKKSPRQWWPVVVGNARQGDLRVPPPNLITSITVKYQQGDWNQCLFKATASALHYCGKSEAASFAFNAAPTVQYLPRKKAILSLRDRIMIHAPDIGGVIAFNQHSRRRKMNRTSLDELVQNQTIFPTMVIPRANDRSASHAVVVVDDIIFDATQSHAMELSRESFEWICGKHGVEGIERALHFEKPTRQRRGMPGQWQRTGSPWICTISFINLTNNSLINIQKQPNARNAIFPDNKNALCSLEASSNDK